MTDLRKLDQPCAVAIDIGGTCLKAGLVTSDGAVLFSERLSTPRHAGPTAVLDFVLEIAAILAESASRNFRPPVAAGLSVPGIIDEDTGIAVEAVNFGWKNIPLRDLVTAHLDGLPTAIGHDIRMGGLAESRMGKGSSADRFIFIAIGTGIAAAHFIAGRVEAGAHHKAGELGHVVVRPGGPLCACGKRGCLEAIASGSAIGRLWAEATGRPDATAADVAAAVEAGDPAAVDIWHDAISALADGIATVQTLLDTEMFVVGGGLAEARDVLFKPLREEFAQRITFESCPEILPSELGDYAACVGAGLHSWDLVNGEGL